MKLTKLILQNFQGIKDLVIEGTDKNIIIKGDNGTGKTTVANAICYLLYGKPSTDEKGYNPKTIDTNGNDVHYLNHIAEGVFKLDDGSIITLKKDYHENWSKKKGSNTESFTGNVMDHYIDGVPVSETFYKNRLEEICDSNKARMLTSPTYFADELDWKKRRDILIEVCGDISDTDVIDSSDELAPITDYLLKPGTTDQFYTIDEYSAIAKAQKTAINKELQMIPARIDEAKKAIQDVDMTATEIDSKIKEHTQLIDSLQFRKTTLNTGNKSSSEITELELELSQKRLEYNEKVGQSRELIIDEGTQCKEVIVNLQDEYREVNHKKKNSESDLSAKLFNRKSLLEQYNVIAGEQFTHDETCPTCGQPIPADEIEKAKELFNLDKSNKLERINIKGQECSTVVISKIEQEIKRYQDLLTDIEHSGTIAKEKLLHIESKLTEVEPFESTKEYGDIMCQIAEIKTNNTSSQDRLNQKKKDVDIEIEKSKAVLEILSAKKQSLLLRETQLARIAELSEQEKVLSKQYEYTEFGVWLCDEFVRIKSSMLTQRINSKFDTVSFQLFKPLVNGGQDECCNTMVATSEGLKPFSKANTGAKINGGIEITQTLGEYWGVTMPIVLDNCESVTNIKDTLSQQIRLYVQPNVTSLQVN